MICIMKELGAPITYDINVQSYVYPEPVKFRFGFYVQRPATFERSNGFGEIM